MTENNKKKKYKKIKEKSDKNIAKNRNKQHRKQILNTKNDSWPCRK